MRLHKVVVGIVVVAAAVAAAKVKYGTAELYSRVRKSRHNIPATTTS